MAPVQPKEPRSGTRGLVLSKTDAVADATPESLVTAAVGIIVNGRAGKDVRRLVNDATAPTDAGRVAELRRMLTGALRAGAERVVVVDDAHGLVERAVQGHDERVEILEIETDATGDDSARGAAALRELEVDAVVVSGGDGTHGDVARGWRDAPIVARAAGTNNAFPQPIEATVAGAAAGLVATSDRPLDEFVAYRALAIDIEVEGEFHDVALVNAAVLRNDLGGGATVWQVDAVDQVFAAIAEPWSVGLSALAGVVAPTSRSDDRGVLLDLDPDSPQRIVAATSPGYFADAGLRSVSVVDAGQPVAVRGPAHFAVDGERSISLGDDQWGSMTMRRNGPRVIDIRRTFSIAVREARFYDDPTRA